MKDRHLTKGRTMNYSPETIINFWFKELTPKDWFMQNDEVDQKITRRYGELLKKASQGELAYWRETALGLLAEIIVLDQFSRNVYRGTPEAFSQDPMALTLSQQLIQRGLDKNLAHDEKRFAYLPFMHSESMAIHHEAMKIFTDLGEIDFEKQHYDIIEKFGRYPHRNEALGRKSTSAEIEFLKRPNSSF